MQRLVAVASVTVLAVVLMAASKPKSAAPIVYTDTPPRPPYEPYCQPVSIYTPYAVFDDVSIEQPEKPTWTPSVPLWVLQGIAKVETRSTLQSDGSIDYVDRRVGKSGDSGVFQMTRIAFRDIALPGEKFSRIKTDPEFARTLAERYLCKLHKRYKNWDATISAYNAGRPGTNAGTRYLNKVKKAAGK